jgi:signal transduction histidine kinase
LRPPPPAKKIEAIVSHHWLIPLFAAAANFLMSAGLLRRALRDRAARIVGLLGLLGAAWNLDFFALYYFSDPARADWWACFFRTFMCFGPPVILHSAVVVMDYRGPLWRRVLVFGYGFATALAVANALGLLTSGVTPHIWGWYPVPTPVYRWFSLSIGLNLTCATALIWLRYRRPTSARQRVQCKLLLLGSIAQIPFLATNLAVLYGVTIYPLGSLGNVLWTGIFIYAVARHRLLDVDYVVRKVLSFALAATPVLIPGGAALAALADLLGSDAPLVVAFASVALALVSVILIPTLQQALETRLHRALFPDRYDSQRRLRELAAALVHVVDRSLLVRRLGDALRDILDVDRVEVLLPDERGRHLEVAYPASGGAPFSEDATRSLETLGEATLVNELEAAGASATAVFRARGWELGIPLRINERCLGFVGLGQNRDLRLFSAEDLELLGTVAAAAAVALENAMLSRQLRRSEAVLEQANRLSSVGMLAAGLAHEIRNPLVAVKTFLDLLPQRLDDKEFLGKFRELSLGELRRVTDLINDLLSFGKSARAERRAVDVREALEPVVRLMQSTARKREVDLLERFDPELPAVWADADQLKQIALNLVLNAIEASPPEGHVYLSAQRAGEVVVLEVRDEGSGIPPDKLEDIFHPFFTTKETGTGLGLALVHQIVLEHGGGIVVESQVDCGTVFRVTLPVAKADVAAA